MNRYAVVNEHGVVINVIVYNGSDPYVVDGVALIQLDDDTFRAGIGWVWDGQQFTPPAEPELPA